MQTAMTGESLKVVFDWLRSQPMVSLLMLLTICDIVTGLAAAFVTKTASSDVSYVGMIKKSLMWLLVGISAAVAPLSPDIPVLKLTASFFALMEGLSILENCGRCGVPIPPVLKDALVKLRTDNGISTTTTTTTTATATTTTKTPPAPASDTPAQVEVSVEVGDTTRK